MRLHLAVKLVCIYVHKYIIYVLSCTFEETMKVNRRTFRALYRVLVCLISKIVENKNMWFRKTTEKAYHNK